MISPHEKQALSNLKQAFTRYLAARAEKRLRRDHDAQAEAYWMNEDEEKAALLALLTDQSEIDGDACDVAPRLVDRAYLRKILAPVAADLVPTAERYARERGLVTDDEEEDENE